MAVVVTPNRLYTAFFVRTDEVAAIFIVINIYAYNTLLYHLSVPDVILSIRRDGKTVFYFVTSDLNNINSDIVTVRVQSAIILLYNISREVYFLFRNIKV